MKLNVAIGPGKMMRMLQAYVRKRLKKRRKKGIIEYTETKQEGGVYFVITGNDEYVRQVHTDLTGFFKQLTDDNIVAKAFEKAAQKSPGAVSRWMQSGEENAKKKLKMFMLHVFNMEFWLTDGNGQVIEDDTEDQRQDSGETSEGAGD